MKVVAISGSYFPSIPNTYAKIRLVIMVTKRMCLFCEAHVKAEEASFVGT